MKSKRQKIVSDISDTALSLLPALPGLLTPEIISNPQAVLVAVGQGIAANKLAKFIAEFKERKSSGEIRDDLPQDALLEILETIQENTKDEKLEAAKKLFFRSAHPNTTAADQALLFELSYICRKLTTNELQILKAAYELQVGKDIPETIRDLDLENRSRGLWVRTVSLKIGHGLGALVESSELHLEELKLIYPRSQGDNSVFVPLGAYRLTDLGLKLCTYLSEG